MPRKIEKILSDIVAAKQVVYTVEETIPYNLRAGIGIQIAGAKERLPKLIEELKQETIPSRVVGCFATGDPAKIAEVRATLLENRGVCLDASSVYSGITDLVEPSIGPDRKFDITQYNLMVQEIVALARRFNLPFVDPPTYIDATTSTRADVLNHIRTQLHIKTPFFVGMVVAEELMSTVINNGLVDRKFPVLVENTSPQDREVLAPLFVKSGVTEFTTDFEPTKEAVTAVFRSFN